MTSGRWKSSTRRDRLPADWPKLRAMTFARDGAACTWVVDGERCWAPATDCDHVNRGDDHSLANLTSLCSRHHAEKSAQEGVQARKEKARATLLEPDEHPGWR
jgi:hypothetical protein